MKMSTDKCGYSLDCENTATHTSCDFGNVCAEHKCLCSKELGCEKTKTEKVIIEPKEGNVEIETAFKKWDGGLKIKWEHSSRNAIVEEKINGEWQVIGGIKKLKIEFDIEKVYPVVTMERII